MAGRLAALAGVREEAMRGSQDQRAVVGEVIDAHRSLGDSDQRPRARVLGQPPGPELGRRGVRADRDKATRGAAPQTPLARRLTGMLAARARPGGSTAARFRSGQGQDGLLGRPGALLGEAKLTGVEPSGGGLPLGVQAAVSDTTPAVVSSVLLTGTRSPARKRTNPFLPGCLTNTTPDTGATSTLLPNTGGGQQRRRRSDLDLTDRIAACS